MRTDVRSDEVADLATWARERLPRLVESAYQTTVERIPFYGESSAVPEEDLRGSIQENMEFLVDAMLIPDAVDVTIPRETGSRRARQGAPLSEVLRCYRLCFATLWDAVVGHARSPEGPHCGDALLQAAGTILHITEQHATVLSESYRETAARLLLTRQQRRAALVEALLTGFPGPAGGSWEAAALLGMPARGRLAVVAADTPKMGAIVLTDVESRLAEEGIVSAWRLAPGQHVGVVSLDTASFEQVLDVLDEVARARTGVSPTYEAVEETPRALRLAQVARACIPPGGVGIRVFNASPLDALMALDPTEGARLAHEVLGTVLGLPCDERDILLDTLNAFLDHKGSAEKAASVLYCHPNTVRYRLRRLHSVLRALPQ